VFDADTNPARQLTINGGSMNVETDIFSGRIEIHLKGLKTTRREVFEGKKRFFQVAVQVRARRCGDREIGGPEGQPPGRRLKSSPQPPAARAPPCSTSSRRWPKVNTPHPCAPRLLPDPGQVQAPR
jgi:hypothetical protein